MLFLYWVRKKKKSYQLRKGRSYITAIPTYIMACYKIPESLCEELHSKMANIGQVGTSWLQVNWILYSLAC